MIEASETPSQPWPSATTVTLGVPRLLEEPWTSQTGEKEDGKKKILWKKVTEKFQSFLYPHPVFFQSNKYWQ